VPRLKRIVWAIEKVVEWMVISLFLFLVGIIFLGVVFRYGFNNPLSWPTELSTFVFTWLSYLGAALCLKEGAMIDIDIAMRRIPQPVKGILETIRDAVMAAVSFLVFSQSYRLFRTVRPITPTLGIPMRYVHLGVGIGFAMMGILGLARMIDDCRHIGAVCGQRVDNRAAVGSGDRVVQQE